MVRGLFLVAILFFVFALVLIVRALGVFPHEVLFEPKKLASSPELLVDDEEFRRDRIVDVAVAYERNSTINEKRAALLKYASHAMVAGISVTFLSLSFLAFVAPPP